MAIAQNQVSVPSSTKLWSLAMPLSIIMYNVSCILSMHSTARLYETRYRTKSNLLSLPGGLSEYDKYDLFQTAIIITREENHDTSLTSSDAPLTLRCLKVRVFTTQPISFPPSFACASVLNSLPLEGQECNMWTSNKIRLTLILLPIVSTIADRDPKSDLQFEPSTPLSGQPVTAKWEGSFPPLPGFQFEILQGSSTVASPVDFSPTQVDPETQEFVFTAPASAGTFDLVVLGNDGSKKFSTTLVVNAAPTHAASTSSNTDVPGANQGTTSTMLATSMPAGESTASLGNSSEPTVEVSSPTVSGGAGGSDSPDDSPSQIPVTRSPVFSISTTASVPDETKVGVSQPVPISASESSAKPGKTSFKSSQHPNVGVIVGGVIGGVVGILLLLTALLCTWRRRARERLSSSASTSTFQRDLMVRSKSDSPSAQGLQMRDSQVFQFGAFEKVSPSRRASSSSIDDADEKTPSLANFTSSPTRRQSTRPTSPTATSIYTDYTQSTEVQYDSVVPRIPARTDRQMEIQERIMDLRGQMIGMVDSGNAGELSIIRERIKKLEEAQNSEWALEMSDVPPPGLEGVLQSEGMAK